MAEAHDIARWIDKLADPDPNARLEAARHLYRAGLDLCQAPLNQWKTDPAFRELTRIVPGPSGITVGIAVQAQTFEKIRAANGSPRLAEVPPDQDAREFELHFEDRAALDILTTRDSSGSGAIARYLQRFGEGIQQIEINVSDVDRATEILRARFGLEPVYPATRAGADGTRVNFFLVPGGTGQKVLIELVETAGAR
jgi:methylmalonyl-CoA/ethylmalonyl-CoA epimerase